MQRPVIWFSLPWVDDVTGERTQKILEEHAAKHDMNFILGFLSKFPNMQINIGHDVKPKESTLREKQV